MAAPSRIFFVRSRRLKRIAASTYMLLGQMAKFRQSAYNAAVSNDSHSYGQLVTMCDLAKKISLSFMAALVFIGNNRPLSAQLEASDSKGDDEQALVERWYEVYEQIISSITVSHTPAHGASVQSTHVPELKKQTILTLNSTQNAERHGKLYLWEEEGRPIILGVIMSYRDINVPKVRGVAYEFNSLTQGTATASRYGEVIWKCDKPGVEWKTGLTDLVPANNRAIRSAQMAAIARQFNAGKYESERMKNEFRLMPRPIYRYPENTPGVTDGAIFSFAIGTDPCIFLLVEARQNLWHLACARSNAFDLRVRKGEEVIWSFDRHRDGKPFQTGAWYSNYVAERRVGDDPSKILFSSW